MNRRHIVWSSVLALCTTIASGCASGAPSKPPRGLSLTPSADRHADERALAERRAGTQPLRLRQPHNLHEGRFAAAFRFEDTPRNGGLQASAAYGVDDDLMLQARVGIGHQFETVALAEDPGRLFDVAAQYKLLDDEDLTVAARLDVLFADASSFELVADSAKVSIQPGVLLGLPIGDGVELYADTSLRLADGVEPTLATGIGLTAPLGRLRAFVELDTIAQRVERGRDVMEAYLTPGVQFALRDRIDISLAPSIGLSRSAEDWRVALTFGVHF